MKFSGVEGRGARTSRLDFRGDTNHDPDPGFLRPNHDRDPGILKRILYLLLRFL